MLFTLEVSDLLIAARDYGVDIFFQFYVYADSKNTSYNTLFFDQGTLTLGRGARDYYLNTSMFASHINAYRRYMQDVSPFLTFLMNYEDRPKKDLSQDSHATYLL